MPSLPVLSVIGCGRLGRSLARLWAERGVFQIGELASRSAASVEETRRFVGAGRALASVAEMQPADVFLIATPDGAIADAAAALAACGAIRHGCCAFHCSGARSSELLAPLAALGAETASAHPVLSFASPERAVAGFAGSHCGLEGTPAAERLLEASFAALGARCFHIDARHKLLYHAGSVFASNFSVVLLDLALAAYRDAGLDPAQAQHLLRPLVEGAIANALSLGPGAALSGPAARGDLALVREQQACVAAWQADAGAAYAALSRLAVALAARTRKSSAGEN